MSKASGKRIARIDLDGLLLLRCDTPGRHLVLDLGTLMELEYPLEIVVRIPQSADPKAYKTVRYTPNSVTYG